jgi:Coenzyme PQQ synthesis protein D (PqqD)
MNNILLRKTEFPEAACDSCPGQVFVRSRCMVSRRVAGETLIVPVRGKVGDLASIFSFNGTGSLIWDLLQAPATLTELVSAVKREYKVDQDDAQKDVTRFLNDMLSVGLLEICPAVTTVATETAEEEVFLTTSSVGEELQAGS